MSHYPMGMVKAEEPSPPPIQRLPPCLFEPSSTSALFIHVFLYQIFASSKWPISPVNTNNIPQIHFVTNSLLSTLSVWPKHLKVILSNLSAALHFTPLALVAQALEITTPLIWYFSLTRGTVTVQQHPFYFCIPTIL